MNRFFHQYGSRFNLYLYERVAIKLSLFYSSHSLSTTSKVLSTPSLFSAIPEDFLSDKDEEDVLPFSPLKMAEDVLEQDSSAEVSKDNETFLDEDFLDTFPTKSVASSTTEVPLSDKEKILMVIDSLCDDLFACDVVVLKRFAKTRNIYGSSKQELVKGLVQHAYRNAHGAVDDLNHTKKVLGNVFKEDVRVSGMRQKWSDSSLEASHMELACKNYMQLEQLGNSSRVLMSRRNGRDGVEMLRSISRKVMQEYPFVSNRAVGGIFRQYKQEVDDLLTSMRLTEILSPFTVFCISHVRYATSMNLLSRVNILDKLCEMNILKHEVEEPLYDYLDQLMAMHQDITQAVNLREKPNQEGTLDRQTIETPQQLFSSTAVFVEDISNNHRNFQNIPDWIHEFAQSFAIWEEKVREDLPDFKDVNPLFFYQVLCGTFSWHLLRKIYGENIVNPNDICQAMRLSVRVALIDHFQNPDQAAIMFAKLLTYLNLSGEGTLVRPDFFVGVLSQVQLLGSHSIKIRGHRSDLPHITRVGLIMNEICATGSRCARACSLFHLAVRLTEDLRFHFRFYRVFRLLNTKDKNIIRKNDRLNLTSMLNFFEKNHGIQNPISVRAVAFLVIQLLFLSMQPPRRGLHQPIQRYSSVSGSERFAFISIQKIEPLQSHHLRVALPPKLQYQSWEKVPDNSKMSEKSIYQVLPSLAVKGTSNNIMLLSQAPMMKALDAISKVPWRVNKFMLHVQEAIIREGFGFGKISQSFFPLHYASLETGFYPNSNLPKPLYSLLQQNAYITQRNADWKALSELRSTRVHYLQALRQARAMVSLSHIYFPNSLDFRGRMYPLPGRLNHTGSDPFRSLLEYAEPKPLGDDGIFWLKVHLANKMGMTKLSFDDRVRYVDEHIEDIVRSAEAPLHGDKWWQQGSEPLQCLMACKELSDALKCSQGAKSFLSHLPVAVDGSYNGLQHYSAIGRDYLGGKLVNLLPSDHPADAYTGILEVMMREIIEDSKLDHVVALRCLGTGKGLDRNHIRRKTIKRPIMTQVYGVTNFGMAEQIVDELTKQNAAHALWTVSDIREMANYLRDRIMSSLGVTFKQTQLCRKWLSDVAELVWNAQPRELRNVFSWTTPLGLVVQQPYRHSREISIFTHHGATKIPTEIVGPASRKQLSALAPNLIHSLDATHLAMTAVEMSNQGLSMMAVHDSYWSYACDMPKLSKILRSQFVKLYTEHDPLWELKEQWEEIFFYDLRRQSKRIPDPPERGDLDLKLVLDSPYFFS